MYLIFDSYNIITVLHQILFMYISRVIQIFFQIKTQEKDKDIQVPIQINFKGFPNTYLNKFQRISKHKKSNYF